VALFLVVGGVNLRGEIPEVLDERLTIGAISHWILYLKDGFYKFEVINIFDDLAHEGEIVVDFF
jgi:hypothetical protein